ncbi:MAG: hypothetical protein QOJ00_1686 [Actinomycetota bacterium]|jgi:hypothetical protein
MAGYSGTPLPKKLGIKEGSRVAVLHKPDGFDATLGELPDNVTVTERLGKSHDVIVAFVDSRAHLERAVAKLEQAVFPNGAIWVAWPKKASKVPTDITEDTLREVCLPRGLVDVKVCAIDDTWSGLKLVWRKELRT